MTRVLKRLLPIALLLAGTAAVAALINSKPKPEAIEVQEKVWNVAVITAKPQRLNPTVTLYARTESPRAATLRAAITADVIDVIAREGDDARSTDLLVKLDSNDAQSKLAQREADVAELRAELDTENRRVANDRASLIHESTLAKLAQRAVERAQRLAKRDLGSASVLDEARQEAARQAMSVDNRRFAIAGHESRVAALNARLARAQSLQTMAELDVQRTRIVAPFNARIAAVSIAPGDRVRVGDPLVEVFDPDAIELRAQVPSDFLDSLRTSLANNEPSAAKATIGKSTVNARLDRLSARIERGRAGADALFSVDNSTAHNLELGRTVQLFVSLPAIDQVVPVPAEALYGVDRVYLLEDGRMRSITVRRMGEFVNDGGQHRLLISSDKIGDNAKIVATQLPSAVDGLKVRAVQ